MLIVIYLKHKFITQPRGSFLVTTAVSWLPLRFPGYHGGFQVTIFEAILSFSMLRFSRHLLYKGNTETAVTQRLGPLMHLIGKPLYIVLRGNPETAYFEARAVNICAFNKR